MLETMQTKPCASSNEWLTFYQYLVDYHHRYGHLNFLPEIKKQMNGRLPIKEMEDWCRIQRKAYKEGGLTTEQISMLNRLNFKWALRTILSWDEQWERLAAYCSKYGHCDVPAHPQHPEFGALGIWVMNQRALNRKNELKSEQVAKLNQLGFNWSLRQSQHHIISEWEKHYQQLVRYQKEEGNCLVPTLYRGDESLSHFGSWIRNQRKAKQRGKLSKERIAKLDAIGFAWDYEHQWRLTYQQLEDYYHCHGNLDFEYQGDRQTPQELNWSSWLRRQRRLKRDQQLSPEKIELLDKLNLEWHFDPKWMAQYYQLVEFYQQHGHLRIPLSYHGKTNRHLGSWIHNQRRCRRRGTLTSQQINRLDALGFKWGRSC